ncbi:MAG: NADH-quinone oxidoreductase subunit M [Dehalococcoidia bacterium]|nr:NADH-quinone oxidoreductase subunit M [Dehalococcoidia bacterium]
MDFPYLSAIIFLPVIGAIIIALLPGANPRRIKLTAAFFTAVSFALSLALFAMFDRSIDGPQFVEQLSWIPAFNVQYFMGVDGLSLPLVLLTTFIGFLAVLISWKVDLRIKEYFAWLLLLEMGILGVFCSLDLILFFIFWEVELIPMYMLITIWGTGRKEYSAIKFVLYTLFGSAFMLAGILLLYLQSGTFDMIVLAGMGLDSILSSTMAGGIFFLIIAAYAIKLPIFPLHTWLPDAHTDAPTAVSVVLAGVLLKMGGYGMIRVSVSIFPETAERYALLFVVIAVISVIYGAALTLRQTDLKKLIAYSSVSHMGFVLLGIFALTEVSMTGAVLQMVSHGVITGLLFAMVGLVYYKTHERSIPRLGGLARQMPVIAVVFSIAGFAALGLPGTSGFAAEAITFVGSYGSTMVSGIEIFTILAITGVVFGAGYILWMLRRVFYGPPWDEFNGVPDADRLEKVYIFAFVAVIMLIGLYPVIFTDVIKMGIQPIVGIFNG